MKNKKIPFIISISSFALFFILIILLKTVDVQSGVIANTSIGLAKINYAFLDFFGDNRIWYKITEYLGVLTILEAGVFAVIGLFQWIKRKSFIKVDKSIFLLAGAYIFVIGCYFLFTKVVINYRPVLLKDELESSFPSSHAFTTISVLSLGMIEGAPRIKKHWLKTIFVVSSSFIVSFIVFGRLVSGVHWFTDIIGGVLLSLSIIMLFAFFKMLLEEKIINKRESKT